MIQNQEEWLTPQQAMLPFSKNWTGWRVGKRWTSWSSTQTSIGSCTWGTITLCTSAGEGLICWRQLCRGGPGSASGQQLDYEPTMCSTGQGAQCWECIKNSVNAGWGSSPFPLLCPSEAAFGVLCPIIGFLGKERQGITGESLTESYKDHGATGPSLSWWNTERHVAV